MNYQIQGLSIEVPPTSILLVLKMKFLPKDLLCTHGDSEDRQLGRLIANLDRNELWGAVLSFSRPGCENSLRFVS
jgi:hypothetical protein